MADLEIYADHFLKEFINEAVLGVAYEAHRSFTQGTLFLDENISEEEKNKYKIVVANGFDVFGQSVSGSKKNVECVCPNCNRNMAASRFAPHLEKCMGLGRNSSRIASQRIANSGKLASSTNDGLGVDDDVDDANDADWMVASEASSSRKAKKRKAERSNGLTRGSKSVPSKAKNSPKISSSSSSQHSGVSVASEQSNSDYNNSNVRVLGGVSKSNCSLDENVNHTLSIWQKHIDSTLSGSRRNDDVLVTGECASSASTIVRKTKKSSKHPHGKKNKRRQAATQQSGALS